MDGTTAQLANGQATWTLNATQPATATITITAPSGSDRLYRHGAVNAGSQTFTWNGDGNDGKTWPAGNYTLTATAVDASGQSTTVTTQVEGRSVRSISPRRRRLCRSADRTTRSQDQAIVVRQLMS